MNTVFPQPAARDTSSHAPIDYGGIGRGEKTPMRLRDAFVYALICMCSATLMIYTATFAAALAVDFLRRAH